MNFPCKQEVALARDRGEGLLLVYMSQNTKMFFMYLTHT